MKIRVEEIINKNPVPKSKRMKGSREELLCPRCQCSWYNLDEAEQLHLNGLGFCAECTHEWPTWVHEDCSCFQEIE